MSTVVSGDVSAAGLGEGGRAPRVLVSGPASWNTLVGVERLPEPRPQMVRATGHHQTLGGTSAGKALNLAALGADVVLRTVVGDDEPGARCSPPSTCRGSSCWPSRPRVRPSST